MFNDLTDNKNNKSPEVDDIFAETDDITTPASNNQIKTRQVGLSSVPENDIKDLNNDGIDDREEHEKTGKFLKMAIIFVMVAILILGGYLVYSKFFAGEKTTDEPLEYDQGQVIDEAEGLSDVADNKNEKNDVNNNESLNNDDFVDPLVKEDEQDKQEGQAGEVQQGGLDNTRPAGDYTEAQKEELKRMDSDGDKLNDYDEIFVHKTDPNLSDTDSDGLNDYDEIFVHKTDPLNVDTDGDGLSDYDEITIHETDPLNVDTDGDGHSDYVELINGYNPLGEGLLVEEEGSL